MNRTNLDGMLAEMVVELGEDFAVMMSCDDDVWTAKIIAVCAPRLPLFDRNGDLPLIGKGASVEAALDALDVICATQYAIN